MDEWMDGWMMAHGVGLTPTHGFIICKELLKSFLMYVEGAFALVNIFCLDIGDTLHGYIPEPGSLISLESLLLIVITVLIINGGLLVVPLSNNHRPTLA
jgi:hypothetical protein